MSDQVPVPGVRLETNIGPNHDKHAITINRVRELHNGGSACEICEGAIRRIQRQRRDERGHP